MGTALGTMAANGDREPRAKCSNGSTALTRQATGMAACIAESVDLFRQIALLELLLWRISRQSIHGVGSSYPRGPFRLVILPISRGGSPFFLEVRRQ